MSEGDALDDDLYRRTKQLLEPGEIQLNGAVVHTDYDNSEEIDMMQATIDVGELIAEGYGIDPTDTFVYSGSDDPEFASNQHQGLTLDDEEFVWECRSYCETALSTSSSTTRPAPTTRRFCRISRTRASRSRASGASNLAGRCPFPRPFYSTSPHCQL